MADDRFTRIENALTWITEQQLRQTEDVTELRQMHKSLVVAVLKIAEAQVAMNDEMRNMQRDTQKRFDDTQKQLDQLARNIERFLKGLGSNGKP